ncbi:MAG: C39 family peptidase [Patescibacteria group bacterium]
MIRKTILLGGAILAFGFIAVFFIKSGNLHYPEIQFERISKRIFYFTQNQVAQVIDATKTDVTQIIIPFYPQEHALTCEAAALRMALNYYGVGVSEDELLEKLVFDTKGPKSSNNIWGDPDLGFVGDIDGSVFKGTGYGVYEEPIYELASKYRPAFVMKDAQLEKVLEGVKNGHPVIVWGLLSKRKPIIWQTEEGKKIEAHPGEHARVITGFYGSSSKPTKIILMDPIYGKIRMSKEKFLSDWNVMENRTVVIY